MPSPKFGADYEQQSQFERCLIIESKETGWANRRIARHMSRSDAAVRRCWQEQVDKGKFQRHDGSGRYRVTANRENTLIVRSAFTAPDSSLLAIRRVTRT
ncbi:HTH_Tnp_Tc3_2 domain-containing protein [Trichonephila clavipes]|nr:HTH_Tnp_Tc3_2 domain-containing protein [Trichonephila clavipes]